jgi:hypothetical protein
MTWTLDHPVRSGETAFCAISNVDVTVKTIAERLAGHGTKRPVVFLVFRSGQVTGIDLCGRILSMERIEARYPMAIALATDLLARDAELEIAPSPH